MITAPFLWKGHTVHLSHLPDRTGGVLWMAEVEGTDLIHVMGGRADDDVERIRHLVRDWIDDGMRHGGGMSA